MATNNVINAPIPFAIAQGGTGVTSVTTTPTATAWSGWDASKNHSANSYLPGYTTTATAAATTTLTVASTYNQFFTGSTTQTVVMPDVSTLVLGQTYYIVNQSSGNLTIQSSGGNTILTMTANTEAYITCISTSGTGTASWYFSFLNKVESAGTVTSVSTGAGLTGGPITTTGTVSVTGNLLDIVNNVIAPVKNLIIGGNFDTNPWQRGTSFVSPISINYTADRFFYRTNSATTGTVTITKSADAPTVGQALIFSSNSYLVTVTGTVASLGGTETYAIGYRIEGYDFAQIAQRTFTISFWVKSNTTGTYNITLLNSGNDRVYVTNYTINVANTWEKKTIVVSASPSAGTWNYTNGVGLSLYFTLASGDSGQTPDTWTTFSHWTATANQNLFAAANTFKLALIQVEPGSEANGFQVRSQMEELALCQRYFWKTFNQGVTPAQAVGTANGALNYRASNAALFNHDQPTCLPVVMRTTPSVTYYNPVNANANWYNFGTAADSGAASSEAIGDSAFSTTNPQVVGDGLQQQIAVHATADAEL